TGPGCRAHRSRGRADADTVRSPDLDLVAPTGRESGDRERLRRGVGRDPHPTVEAVVVAAERRTAVVGVDVDLDRRGAGNQRGQRYDRDPDGRSEEHTSELQSREK